MDRIHGPLVLAAPAQQYFYVTLGVYQLCIQPLNLIYTYSFSSANGSYDFKTANHPPYALG